MGVASSNLWQHRQHNQPINFTLHTLAFGGFSSFYRIRGSFEKNQTICHFFETHRLYIHNQNMLLPLFFSLNICFCGGESEVSTYYLKLSSIPSQLWGSTNSLSLSSPRGFAIAAGREEGAPRALHPDCSSREQMERSPGKCRAAELYQWKT